MYLESKSLVDPPAELEEPLPTATRERLGGLFWPLTFAADRMAELSVGSGSLLLLTTNALELSLTSLVMKAKSFTLMSLLLDGSRTSVTGCSQLGFGLVLALFITVAAVVAAADTVGGTVVLFFLLYLFLASPDRLELEAAEAAVDFPEPPRTSKFLAAPRASSSSVRVTRLIPRCLDSELFTTIFCFLLLTLLLPLLLLLLLLTEPTILMPDCRLRLRCCCCCERSP